MGFSHATSTHHFRLVSDGGAIEVTANDPNDKVTRDEIKNHLSHILQMQVESGLIANLSLLLGVRPSEEYPQTEFTLGHASRS